MNPVIKNLLAIVAGVVVGMVINMGLIMASGSIVPPPEGADVTTMEGLKASIHLFEPKHFIMPFLAHALGTFAGAVVAGLIAATHKMKFAMVIGAFFLLAGIANVFMIPAPAWFVGVDLIGAYVPMAYIAGKITSK